MKSTAKHAFPGPDNVVRTQLDNGIILLVRENWTAPVVVLDGFLTVGSIHEPAAKAGLASFTASLLTRGSHSFDFDSFNETVESVGASINMGAGDHVTSFGTESLAEDFPQMVELLADVLRRPTFPAQQMERVRGQWLVRLQEREQNTRSVAHRRFHELLYGDHPYGRPGSGYSETIQSISREDVADFHRHNYGPEGAIIVVSGAITAPVVTELIERHLGDWRGASPDQTLPPISPQTDIRQERIPLAGKVQSDILIGSLSIARSDPDYFAVQVANSILGQFGLMGRLGEVVREEQGLAYYSYSMLDTDIGPGPWLAAAGVNPANVDLAVESIRAEFARLGAEPVSEEELSDSQANMTGRLPLALETNDGVTSQLLNMEWYGLGLDYLYRYADHINAITAEDVQRVAAKYLRADAYTLVVAGPTVE
ncbi:MAG: insulinase family protein [Caldilineaceae bacterium]|nr:insulinase family protein [Caldilineaceae bacterium]